MESLTIVIPARNEMFLARTIEDILKNMRGDKTDIIAVCDGNWPDPPVYDHPKVTLVYHSEAIGQRAATNEAVRLSRSKYVMKVDAHCAFDEGFDVKLMEVMQDDWTLVPIMRNLYAFDWACKKCGDRRYQGPTPVGCPKCDNTTDFERDIKWIGKTNPQSTTYCFSPEPHFEYFNDWKKRPQYKGPLTESMSLQGSCFMVTKEKLQELDLCEETFGSWGSQGIEVAVKTWLSGGKVMCYHNTWYAHMFRTQGGDFGFPWPCKGNDVKKAKLKAKELFFNSRWPKAKRPLSWLVKKFWPVYKWTEEDLKQLEAMEAVNYPEITEVKEVAEPPVVKSDKPTVGFVYYTHWKCDERILNVVRKNLLSLSNGCEIVSVSLKKPLDFGRNIVLNLEPGYLTMFRQQLAGIEASTADILFMTEHDVLYHPSHFKFTPLKKDLFYYDENRWFVDPDTGHALFYHAMSVSMMCGYRELLLKHYRKRVERVVADGRYSWKIGFEPGGHQYPRGIDEYRREPYWAEFPSIDIRHPKTLTANRWSQDQFRNKANLWAWKEAEEIPPWGKTKGRFGEILDSI